MATPGPREKRESRAHQDPKASQVLQAQRVPEENEDLKGTRVRRATRDSKASQDSRAPRVPLDSQAKLEHRAHLAPKQRRAVREFEVHRACPVLPGHQDLQGFRAQLA